jgi:hypothetical protein
MAPLLDKEPSAATDEEQADQLPETKRDGPLKR